MALAAGVVYCRRDFAQAAAEGDFDRAERRAGLLAINDVTLGPWLSILAMTVLFAALVLLARH